MFKKTKPFARSNHAAGGTEYAIIIGLVALITIGGVALSGAHVKKMFELGGNATNTAVNNSNKQPPQISLTANPTAAHPNDSVDVSWSTSFATRITANATYSGTCPHGAGSETLPWTSISGSVSIPWTQNLAGCSLKVDLRASNDTYVATKSASASFLPAVTTPANLSFNDKANVDPQVVTTSNTATVTGIELPATVSVQGGEVSVNGGTWTNAADAPNGATVQLQTTSPSDFSAQKAVQFQAGTTSGTWKVATRARDTDPDQYIFASTPKATPSEIVTSQIENVLAGFDGPLTVDASNGATVSKDGETFVGSGSLEVNPGDFLWVRLTASPTTDGTGTTGTTVSIGGTSANFSVATLDLIADNFAFKPAPKADPSALVVSETQAPPSGFDASLTASATNGALLSTDGANFAATVDVSSGQNLWVQLTASPVADGTGSATTTVTVGGTSATFTVTTKNQQPGAIAFDDSIGLDLNQDIRSNIVTVTSIDGSLPITASHGLMSINGGAGVSNGNVSAGDTVQLLATSPATFATTLTPAPTIQLGSNTPATWTVTTRARDTAPNAFSFAPTAKANPGALVTSQTLAPLDGFDGPLTASGTNNATFSTDGVHFSPTVPVSAGQTLWIQLAASADTTGGGLAASTVAIGSTSAVFTIETKDQMPNAFSFKTAPKADPSEVVTSETTAALDGFDGLLTASATNGATVSTDGVTFTPTVTVATGQDLWVRLTASPAADGTGTASTTVSVGRTSATFAVQTLDLVPDVIAFNDAVDQDPSVTIQSNAVTLRGFDGNLPITASHGLVSINGLTAVANGTVAAGDTVQLSTTSPSSFNTTLSPAPAVQIGSNNPTTWVVTTRTQNMAPNSFVFATAPKADPSAIVTSETTTPLAGFDGPLTATATNGASLSTDGANFASTVQVNPGQNLWVQLTASSIADGTGSVSTAVSVGSTSASFTVLTKDQAPDAIAFDTLTGIEPNATVPSNVVTLSGFDGSLAITASNGLVSINGGTAVASGTVSAGDKIQLTTTSASGYLVTLSPKPAVQIGANNAVTWTVTTRAQDTSPDSFGFAPVAKADPGASVTSQTTAALAGFDGPVTASATNGASLSIDGTNFASTVQVNPGQNLWVKLTASLVNDGTGVATTTVSVGQTSASLTVQTRDMVPASIAFTSLTGVDPNTAVQSNSVTLGGFDGSLPITASHGLISIDGGAGVSSGTVTSGETIVLLTTSASGYLTTLSPAPAVQIASSSPAAWTVTTRARDTAPDNFAFTTIAKADPGVTVTSQTTAALTGFDGPLTAAATNSAALSTDGTNFAATVQVNPGQSLWVRLTSSSVSDGTGVASTTVSVGSTSATFTVQTKNLTPGQISFNDAVGLNINTPVQSNTVTLTGIDGSLPITASHGLVSINGGSGVSSGTVAAGDTIMLKTTSASSYSTTLSPAPAVQIGTNNPVTWTVTTRAQDTTPDSFAFATVAKADPGASVTSETTAALTGFDGPLTASATNGALLSVDGATFATTVAINPGQNLWVKVTASSVSDGTGVASSTVSVGSTSATFTVQTKDLTPGQIVFNDAAGLDINTPVHSNTVTLSGFDGSLPITASHGLVSINGGSGVSSGTVSAGDNIQISATSAPSYGTTLSPAPAVQIGSSSPATWTVTTRAQDTAPNSFVFAAAAKADPGIAVTSQTTAALTGFDGPLTATATNSAVLSTDGTTFTATVQVNPGQSLWVRLTSSSVTDGTGVASSTVSVGSTSATFTVQTKDLTPAQISFNDAVGLDINTPVQSNTVTLSGFDGSLPITASHGLVSINGGAGVASGTVASGDTVVLSATSAAGYSTTLSPAPAVQIGSNNPVSWTVTTRAQDTAPNSFAFATVAKADPGVAVTSQTTAALTGFDGPLTASATNGALLSVDGTTFAATVAINPGQNLWVKVTASSVTDGTGSTTTTITVGQTSANFTVQTKDLIPDAWSLGNSGPYASGTFATSPAVSFTGFDGTANIAFSSSNAANAIVNVYRASTGTWSGGVALQTITVSAGDQMQLGMTTPSGSSATGTITATLTTAAANMPRTWTVTANDTIPNAFGFSSQSGVSRSTAIASNAVTVSGFDGTLTATCGTNCTNIARNGVWGGTSVAGFASGDTIAIQQTSSASYSTSVTATVSLGGTSGTFTTTTVAASCPSQTINWGIACSATAAGGPAGTVRSLSSSSSRYAGNATATCNAAGAWSLSNTSCIDTGK